MNILFKVKHGVIQTSRILIICLYINFKEYSPNFVFSQIDSHLYFTIVKCILCFFQVFHVIFGFVDQFVGIVVIVVVVVVVIFTTAQPNGNKIKCDDSKYDSNKDYELYS